MKDNAIEWFEMLKAKMKDTEFESYLTNAIKALEAQKIGHWIERHNVYGVAFCSECSFELRIDNTNYCPNCGARMEGQE